MYGPASHAAMRKPYLELSAATTIAEVVRVARRCIREARNALPPEGRGARVRGARDIERWADRLDEASARSRPLRDEETALDRLASDLLIASLRVRQLERPSPQPYMRPMSSTTTKITSTNPSPPLGP